MVEWVDLLIILSLGIKNGLVVVTALNGRYSLGMKLHGGRPSANVQVTGAARLHRAASDGPQGYAT
jgi:hypothetical protein